MQFVCILDMLTLVHIPVCNFICSMKGKHESLVLFVRICSMWSFPQNGDRSCVSQNEQIPDTISNTCEQRQQQQQKQVVINTHAA
mgnify:CR=1 FL=1